MYIVQEQDLYVKHCLQKKMTERFEIEKQILSRGNSLVGVGAGDTILSIVLKVDSARYPPHRIGHH